MALPEFQLSGFIIYPSQRDFNLYVCILSVISEIEGSMLSKFKVFIRQHIKIDTHQCEGSVYYSVFCTGTFWNDFCTVVH